MRRMLLVAVLAAMLSTTAIGAGGGSAPRWIAPIDSRTTDQWLSEDADAVYGARGGTIVALDLHDGHVRWGAAVQPWTKSAAGGNAVAIPTSFGVAFLRASDGRPVRSVRLRKPPLVASGPSGFVSVTETATGVEARGWTFDGRPRWTKHYAGAPFGTLLPLGGDAIGLTVPGSGNTLVIDARSGNAVAAVDGVDTLIGADGRYLWFNVVGGGIKGVDLNTTRTLALHGSIVRGAARVEHGVAVAVVGGRLTRLDLARGATEPLKVDGRWIGGPTAGRIFIERGDGVYVREIAAGARQRRVVRYAGDPRMHPTAGHTREARIVAADGRIGMIAMDDGRIFVVDVLRAQELAQIDTPCVAYEGFAAADATTLVHCDDRNHVSKLVAFRRYARSSDLIR